MGTPDERTFDFLSILTGVAVLSFFGTAIWALVTTAITWQDFLAAVGTPTATLLGYWVRGSAK